MDITYSILGNLSLSIPEDRSFFAVYPNKSLLLHDVIPTNSIPSRDMLLEDAK